ncbi:GFA family protein [Oceanicola sp. D3]|uniref:GFA family protein n=1 Tax=Oceanicola sp. D3 TaxID=2587163 RepID=UPI00112090F0|nr:GFA family protein [Oceanicola sp. D3]QDC08542.1 GFA family protein [Oceanicola sp. D3]
MSPHSGACLCGAIRFTVDGTLPAPTACHCSRCRKQSGHYEASTDVPKAALRVTGTPSWFASSAKARRGFCPTCGATLFFDPLHHEWIGVSMGAFEGPTGTRLARHIFTGAKGDYYDIADGLPQNRE